MAEIVQKEFPDEYLPKAPLWKRFVYGIFGKETPEGLALNVYKLREGTHPLCAELGYKFPDACGCKHCGIIYHLGIYVRDGKSKKIVTDLTSVCSRCKTFKK